MKLEDQVAPLELARELKALGLPQRTLHYWTKEGSVQTETEPWAGMDGTVHGEADCAAPTVAEMGEWLPSYAFSFQHEGRWRIEAEAYNDAGLHGWDFKTEAEARARLVIALAKRGVVSPQEYRR